MTDKIPDEVRAELDRDIFVYGTSYLRRHEDGRYERIPPTQMNTCTSSREMATRPPLEGYTTKELIAVVRTRQAGTDLLPVDEIDKAVDALDMGQLGALRRRVNAQFEYKASLFTGLTDEENALIAESKKLEAVKSVRLRTGLGLADAKELVDRWQGKAK